MRTPFAVEGRDEPSWLAELDWRIVASTFVSVFFAELGDKTQLSTMMLASSKKAPWSVFLGSASALVLSSLIGVLVGDTLYRVVPAHIIRLVAGAGFVVIGALILFGRL
ncbi:MAG: TMEM165/GDT1 family protein [Bacillota bacterium]